jgi:hypothetical protein
MSNTFNKIIDLFGPRGSDSARGSALDRDATRTLEIDTPSGARHKVVIGAFSALDGWTVKSKMRDYATSTDIEFKREFALTVLAQAAIDGRPLNTVDIVNELLERWENIDKVFDETLRFNRIDTYEGDVILNHWQVAGAEMAAAFSVHVEKMIGPMFKAATKEGDDNG